MKPHRFILQLFFANCSNKLVDDFNRIRYQASEPVSTFLNFLTHGHMIDNVILVISGKNHELDLKVLLDKCHPLGLFDSISSLTVPSTMKWNVESSCLQLNFIYFVSNSDLYRLVLADSPLSPYFGECTSDINLDELNLEFMRSKLYKEWNQEMLAIVFLLT